MSIVKAVLFGTLFCICGFAAYCQRECRTGDGVLIKFAGNDGHERVVKDLTDLCYAIVVTNNSIGSREVYKMLIWNDTSSKFANYYWVLSKKGKPGYSRIAPQHSPIELGYLGSE